MNLFIPTAFILLSVCLPISHEGNIPAMIDSLREGTQKERRSVAQQLISLGKEVVPYAVMTLKGEHPGLEEKAKGIVREFADDSWETRSNAARAAVKIGKAALPFWEKEKDSPDPEIRWRINFIIAEIKKNLDEEEMMEDIQFTALCEVLEEIGDDRCAEALIKLVGDQNESVRIAAERAIGRLRPKTSVTTLESSLKGKSWREQYIVVWALGELKSATSVQPIVDTLSVAENIQLKEQALRSLASIGGAQPFDTIIGTLSSPDVYVRHTALSLLQQAAGASFGYDPLCDPEKQRAAIEKFREWWRDRFTPKSGG